MTFKVGDKVKIRRDSEFYWQSGAIGTIITLTSSDWWSVDFIDGTRNEYRNKDLELVEAKVYGIVKFCQANYK